MLSDLNKDAYVSNSKVAIGVVAFQGHRVDVLTSSQFTFSPVVLSVWLHPVI